MWSKALEKSSLISIRVLLVAFKLDLISSRAIKIIYKIYVPSTWDVSLKYMSLGSIGLSLFSMALEMIL